MSLDWTPPVDPFDPARLPAEVRAAGRCELDELLVDLSPRQASAEAVRYLLHGALLAPLVGVLPRYLGGGDERAVAAAHAAGLGVLLLAAFALYLRGAGQPRRWLLAAAGWLALVLGWRVQAEAADASDGYWLTFPLAVAACGAYAVLVAKQYAFCSTASLALGWRETAVLRGEWEAYEAGREAAAEFTAARRAVPVLVAAVLAGWACLDLTGWTGAGAAGYLLALAVLSAPVWGAAGVTPAHALAAAWRAVRVFLTYNRSGCPAPGVFQLPTAWVRPHARRYALTLGLLAGGGLSLGTSVPARWPALPDYPVAGRPPLPPETDPRPPMTYAELDHLDRLEGPTARADYLDLVRGRRAAESAAVVAAEKNLGETALTTAVACVLIPPALLLGTLAFLFGPALVAYDRASRGTSP